MSKSIYGYVRVSTKEQNLDRQFIAMKQFGVPEGNIFVDRQSGKDFERPSLWTGSPVRTLSGLPTRR